MHEGIIKALKKTAGSDRFCTKVVVKCQQGHGLTVVGVGPVRLPISEKTAKALITVAKPAKFGQREKTISDTRVRDTWEIPNSKLKFDQPAWRDTLQGVLERVREELGLPAGALTAELHNLLIYEKGQHFKAHQDSEKVDGMVATLVVLLPSKFSGGALVVDQRGDKKMFKAAGGSDQLTFVAFYADCHHEVRKVTSGYRVALTYNPASAFVAVYNIPDWGSSRCA